MGHYGRGVALIWDRTIFEIKSARSRTHGRPSLLSMKPLYTQFLNPEMDLIHGEVSFPPKIISHIILSLEG